MSADPVVARVHSLLLGHAVRRGAIDIVPIHARIPSEAADRSGKTPRWRPDAIAAKTAAPGIARLRHEREHPVLVVPGLFVRRASVEYQVTRADVVPADGALYVPVQIAGIPRLLKNDASAGLASATSVALALARGAKSARCATEDARGTRAFPGYSHWARDTSHWFPSRDGTTIGCVLLVGGKPVSAQLFATHELFRDAWSDVLATAIMEHRAALRFGAPNSLLEQRAGRGNPQGRALSLLRELGEGTSRKHEVPGGGWRWNHTLPGYAAQALIDAKQRVLFLGVYRVPPRAKTGSKPAKRPGAPSSESDEDIRELRKRRFNPFPGRGQNPGGRPEPIVPPR